MVLGTTSGPIGRFNVDPARLGPRILVKIALKFQLPARCSFCTYLSRASHQRPLCLIYLLRQKFAPSQIWMIYLHQPPMSVFYPLLISCRQYPQNQRRLCASHVALESSLVVGFGEERAPAGGRGSAVRRVRF